MNFETTLYRALIAANVPDEHATNVIEALGTVMDSILASKTDVKVEISNLRTELMSDIAKLHR